MGTLFHTLPLTPPTQTKTLPKKTTVKTMRQGLIKSVNFSQDPCTFSFPIL